MMYQCFCTTKSESEVSGEHGAECGLWERAGGTLLGWESIPPSALYQWKSDLASDALTMKHKFMIHCSTVKFLFNQ